MKVQVIEHDETGQVVRGASFPSLRALALDALGDMPWLIPLAVVMAWLAPEAREALVRQSWLVHEARERPEACKVCGQYATEADGTCGGCG